MSKRRASIFTIKSVSALSQISSPLPPPPLFSPSLLQKNQAFKASSPILRWLSTAALRDDFPLDPHGAQEPPRSLEDDHIRRTGGGSHQNRGLGHHQNPTWQQRRDGLYGDGGRLSGEFYQSGDRQYWGSTGDARSQQQRADGFHGTSDRGFLMSPNANDMSNGGHLYDNSDRRYQNLNLLSGYGGGGTGLTYQNAGGLQRENLGDFQQEYSGHYGAHQGQAYQNPNGYGRENSTGEFLNNPQGFCRERPAGIQQRQNELHADIPIEFQHHSSASVNSRLPDFPPMGSTAADTVSPTAVPSEAGESSSYKGTADELDGLCKEGKLKEAVQVLSLIQRSGVILDRSSYLCLLGACGEAGTLEEARAIHDHMSRVVAPHDVGLYNRLLGLYSKCGSVADAYQLFERMPQRNLTSWDTMILGLANNGLGEEAIDLFNQFKEKGLVPDGHFFVTIFSACGVLGAIDEGMLYFESMLKDFNITPSLEHYVSIVDMLGKSGYLDEAVEFIEKMPIEPSVDVWETLMNLSRLNGNEEVGQRCAEIVENMDPSRYTEQAKLGLLPVNASELAREKERKKSNLLAGRSRQHELRAGDKSHPEHVKIYEQIRGLAPQMKEAGYVPETRFVLHDVDEESKEEALLHHSEKLATAYGLMTSPARSAMTIYKNLRFCGDCHNALKIISRLVGRKIIARDIKRFHHFQDGKCNCNDYW